jgi:hypothetical protein
MQSANVENLLLGISSVDDAYSEQLLVGAGEDEWRSCFLLLQLHPALRAADLLRRVLLLAGWASNTRAKILSTFFS